MARGRVRLPPRARADLVTSNHVARTDHDELRSRLGSSLGYVAPVEDDTPLSANAAPLPPPRPDAPARNTNAVVATVVGALSVVLFFPFGPVLGPIAIVMGRNARRRAIDGASGKGLATAGVVLGAIGLVAGGYVWIVASVCDCL